MQNSLHHSLVTSRGAVMSVKTSAAPRYEPLMTNVLKTGSDMSTGIGTEDRGVGGFNK